MTDGSWLSDLAAGESSFKLYRSGTLLSMRLWRFFQQIFGHWISGMTGGLSLILAIVALWVPSTPQRLAFGTLAIFCAFTAVYRVWLAETKNSEHLESQLGSSRPMVVPEVVESNDRIEVALTNVGGRSALAVTIDPIKAFDGAATFDTIQILHPVDRRVHLLARYTHASELRQVLGSIHLASALRLDRDGKAGTDFTVPIVLRYTDISGNSYEDRSFVFAWIPSPTGAPRDTQLLIRRMTAVTGFQS